MIGDDIIILICSLSDTIVKIGIQAPDGVRILREELKVKYQNTPHIKKSNKPKCETIIRRKRRRMLNMEKEIING
jgi:carbon storage regulator CsrA